MAKSGIETFGLENSKLNRRDFIIKSASIAGGLTLTGVSGSLSFGCSQKTSFKISLAEWSLHRALQSKDIDHLDFASIAKNDFGIDGIEYVNTFFFEKAEDTAYLNEMKKRASDPVSYTHLTLPTNREV